MALEIKHVAFGKWKVLDGETVVAEGLTKAEAQAVAGIEVDHEPEPPAAEEASDDSAPIPFARDGRELSEAERRREYEKRLEAATKAEGSDIVAATRALWLLKYDPVTVDAMLRTVEPMLRSGADGLRREIRRNQRAAAA